MFASFSFSKHKSGFMFRSSDRTNEATTKQAIRDGEEKNRKLLQYSHRPLSPLSIACHNLHLHSVSRPYYALKCTHLITAAWISFSFLFICSLGWVFFSLSSPLSALASYISNYNDEMKKIFHAVVCLLCAKKLQHQHTTQREKKVGKSDWSADFNFFLSSSSAQ